MHARCLDSSFALTYIVFAPSVSSLDRSFRSPVRHVHSGSLSCSFHLPTLGIPFAILLGRSSPRVHFCAKNGRGKKKCVALIFFSCSLRAVEADDVSRLAFGSVR